MSYTLGDSLSASLALVAGQPLRATWRRSATASAQELFSAGLWDTSMTGLTAKLDEALPGPSHLTRVSPWTYGDETATCDLIVDGRVPQRFTPSEAAYEADRLLVGFPLVRLEGRVRVNGEQNRAEQRDVAAKKGDAEAQSQTWEEKVKELLDGLGTVAKVGLAVGLVVLFLLYAPKPKSAAAPKEA